MVWLSDAPLDDIVDVKAELLGEIATLKRQVRVLRADKEHYRNEVNRLRALKARATR